MNSHQFPFDARLEHRAVGLAALTADTTIVTKQQRAQTRTPFVTNILIESIKISANNEQYQFIVEVSNDGFATNEVAGVLSLGATEARIGGGPDNVAGDEYQMFWNTEVNGQAYKDWRIRLDVSGTSPSIGFAMNSSWKGGA